MPVYSVVQCILPAFFFSPTPPGKRGYPMTLQTRVIGILTKPKDEWPAIASETTDIARLYKEFILLLAAIPAVCGFIGMTLVGFETILVGRYRTGVVSGFSHMIVQYALTLAGVYGAALIIEKLAPSFQSKGDTVQALKLVAYASTPAWIAGVLSLIPPLSVLAVLAALYGIYLFYLGTTPVMQTPEDKRIPFMLVSGVVIIVIYFIVGAVAGVVLRF